MWWDEKEEGGFYLLFSFYDSPCSVRFQTYLLQGTLLFNGIVGICLDYMSQCNHFHFHPTQFFFSFNWGFSSTEISPTQIGLFPSFMTYSRCYHFLFRKLSVTLLKFHFIHVLKIYFIHLFIIKTEVNYLVGHPAFKMFLF